MTNQDIIKGSKLMVFVKGAPIAFATSHSLSMTTNTTEISTKDHGDFPAVLAQNITWELTTENLYSDTGSQTLFDAMLNMKPVTVAFVSSSYENATAEPGIVDPQSGSWTADSTIASGKALITSLSINAAAGDNATLSATFTGVGALDQAGSGGNNQGGATG